MTETVSLTKGENISLTKAAPGLTKVAVGLGWDVRTTTGEKFDLDASAIMCGPDKKVLSPKHFVYYNSKLKKEDGTIPSPDGSILHTGDDRTGGNSDGGDDEVINVDLEAVTPDCTSIVIPVSIDEAVTRRQNFGQVNNAYIHVVNQADGAELARFDLSEDYNKETALVFGELYRNGAEWKFRAVGQGYASGLEGIVRDYGLTPSA